MPKTDLRIPCDVAKAILRYNAEATKILQAFIKTVEAKDLPPVLYHYTNGAGFAGIIESGQLRFSDIFALNDPSELRHGLSIAIDLLESSGRGREARISLCLGARSNGSTSTLASKPPATSSSAASAPTGTILDNGEPMPKTAKDLPWVSKQARSNTLSRSQRANQSTAFELSCYLRRHGMKHFSRTGRSGGPAGKPTPDNPCPRRCDARVYDGLLIYHSMTSFAP